MGPEEALIAVEWISPKIFIPMHYNTFPVIEQDISELVKKVKDMGIEVIIPKIGEEIDI